MKKFNQNENKDYFFKEGNITCVFFLVNQENNEKKGLIIIQASSFKNINNIKKYKEEKEKLNESLVKLKQIDKKIFICSRIYPDIKLALEKRGWVENTDADSNYFDIKWCLRKLDIDYKILKNNKITRKANLCKNLRNLLRFRNVDINLFFLRFIRIKRFR